MTTRNEVIIHKPPCIRVGLLLCYLSAFIMIGLVIVLVKAV
jgi:hypothetical protein